MNLLELKTKIDLLVKELKKTEQMYGKQPENYTVSISTSDAVFGGQHVGIHSINFGFDWDAGQVILQPKARIFTNTDYHLVKTHRTATMCFMDCGRDDCSCKKPIIRNEVYGVFIDDELMFPVFQGESAGEVGLKLVVDKYNKEVDALNEHLNYDKYYDYVQISERNKNTYRGGADNKSIIKLRIIPSESLT